MRVLANDLYITRCLEIYGEYSRAEWELLAQVVKPGMTVVEVGANVGAFSLPLARACAPGNLIAFEPQQVICELLRENLAANGLGNATAIQAAVGDREGYTRLAEPNYENPGNFGAVTLSEVGVQVPMVTIDGLELNALALLKIDVEGAELDVLKGAEGTIGRCRPIIYVENDRAPLQGFLIDAISDLDYRLYWHTPLLADRKNYNGIQSGHFGAPIRSLNMLCIPRERETQVLDLEIIDPANWRSPIGD